MTVCGCGSPDPHFVAFQTVNGSGTCGSVKNDAGASLLTLNLDTLYIGGGTSGQPPSVVPDYYLPALFKVGSCGAGSLTLTNATSTDTGSTRSCTSTGCSYGPPVPVVNPNPSLSVCVLNNLSANASGSLTCGTGASHLDIPLGAGTYLTGDIMFNRCGAGTTNPMDVGRSCFSDANCGGAAGSCVSDTAHTQPCPICNATTSKCNGGAKDVTSCTPGVTVCPDSTVCPGSGICPAVSCSPGTVTDSGDPFPTSLDCPPAAVNLIATLPIAYALDTGTTTKTGVLMNNIGTANDQDRVFCGFCANNSTGAFVTPGIPCTVGSATGDPACPTSNKMCKQKDPAAFGQSLARTITETGSAVGPLTTGGAPVNENAATVFCIFQTGNATIDTAADLPGPGAACVKGAVQLLP